MREIIEKMFLMETDEVLDLFYNLPGAIEGKDYVYIPGTRENRILFVGHADTVFANPPKSVEWNGNYAKAGYAETKDRSLPFPEARRYRLAAPQEAEPEPAVESVARRIAKSAITVTVGAKSYSLDEYETLLKEGKIPQPGSSVRTVMPPARNTRHNEKRRSGYPSGLGADDRAGLAMLWLLRESGHSLLICDVEESGGIGAKSAAEDLAVEIASHQFAIEIDRAGDQEMVFYNVSTPEFERYMQEVSGFSIGLGSYTDIKDVCRAGDICGVNLAAGYLFQHTDKEMFFYDFWLRTYEVVSRLAAQEDLPRFELPRPASTAVVKISQDEDFDRYYQEYEAWRQETQQRETQRATKDLGGPLDTETPISKLHTLTV